MKLRWLIDHHEAVRKAHDEHDLLFGTIESWIVYVRFPLLLREALSTSVKAFDRQEAARNRSLKCLSNAVDEHQHPTMGPGTAKFLPDKPVCPPKDRVFFPSVRGGRARDTQGS